MQRILIAGAGKIGALIACLLATAKTYDVFLADVHFDNADVKRLKQHLPHLHTEILDVQNTTKFSQFIQQQQITSVVSCLPYFVNFTLANQAKALNLNYFDLTEDVKVTQHVKEISKNASTAFVPQCGLAPGFVSIVANSLMQHFDEIDTVKLRVGALPQNPSNVLQYALTWSTDGLINEYGNEAFCIQNGKPTQVHALEGLETIQLEGRSYEAFNTSGGLGSLSELHAGQVKNMNYKTIRYPGHCEKIKFLMNDLKLNDDRDTLKRILEKALPKTYQDVVLIYVAVNGKKNQQYLEENYVKSIYPQTINGIVWSAIQVSTACGICAIIDIVLQDQKKYTGLVHQESIPLETFLFNQFGKYYA